jgi:hypothetical protein
MKGSTKNLSYKNLVVPPEATSVGGFSPWSANVPLLEPNSG